MNQPVSRALYWAPRALGVLLAIFVSLFALDVFGAGYGVWQTVLALLTHLVPTGAVLLALAIAWRLEWAGAILFAALGLVAVWRGGHPWPVRLVLGGPLLLIAALFLAGWLHRREHARGQGGPER